ncbi:hypothetical protein H1215_11085, partial [Anoxybacillus sp. LAT_38]|nr:hypothetical protein [Anoxybacillus sp. LAT_38]
FMTQMSGDEMMIGKSLQDVFPHLTWKPEQKRLEFTYNERTYEVLIRPEERLLYFTDITDMKELTLRYHREKAVLAIIHLDNLDEVGQV